MFDLFGMRVLEAPLLQPKAKIKLGPCAVGDEFRAEFDAWLIERFGYEPERMYVMHTQMGFPMILMSPKSIAAISNIGC